MYAIAFEPKHQSGDLVELVVSGALTIKNAEKLKDMISPFLQQEKDLHLDLSQAVEIDTCGIQFLLVLSSTLAKKGHNLSIKGPVGDIQKCLKWCGLSLGSSNDG